MLLLAHPLNAYRLAGNFAGDERGIASRVVGTIVSVTARPFHVDDMDPFFGHRQHFGDSLAVGKDPLCVRPDVQCPIRLHLRDGAGRADRAVDLVGPRVGRLEHLAVGRERAGFSNSSHLALEPLQRRRQVGLVGQRLLLLPPRGRGQRPHGVHRLEFFLGDDGEEVAVAHDGYDARHRLGHTLIELRKLGRRARGAHDARMQHAIQAQIMHIGGLARDLRRDIDARERLAHHAEGPGLLQGRLRLRLHVQHLAGNELAIGRASPILCQHGFVFGPEFGRRDPEALGGFRDKERAHLCRGVPDGRAAVLHRLAAGRESFVGRAPGVRRDKLDLPRIHLQLLGGNLQKGGADALAELCLAGEDGNRIVRVDADPGIEEAIIVKAARQGRGWPRRRCRRGRRRWLLGKCAAERKTDYEPAGTDDHAAAGDFVPENAHQPALPLSGSGKEAACINSPARLIAARIRICVPQRQRLVASASRISASLGRAFRRNSACALIIMPGMQ